MCSAVFMSSQLCTHRAAARQHMHVKTPTVDRLAGQMPRFSVASKPSERSILPLGLHMSSRL